MKRLAILLTVLATGAGPAPQWTLSPTGYGPARIGMTRAQVSKALHVELEGEAFDNEDSCIDLIGANDTLPGMYFLFEDGKLTRISATEPSAVTTPRGLHVGSTAEEVRKAYGPALKAEPHYYEDLPAEYLTFWLKPEKSGVRFETDRQGKVESIHAGGGSIQYVEGCA